MRDLIAGRYEVKEVLHEGGLKTVFVVRDRRAPERELVLKLLAEANQEKHPPARTLLRFHNEYRVASDLVHPGICRVVDHGVDAETTRPYFVEDRAAGQRLSDLGDHPSKKVLAEIIAQTSRVLGYLHAREIVHFDVKPDNIIVDLDVEQDRVIGLKLLDFDLAGSIGPVESGRGTMPFVAPEVLVAGEIIDGRADLYSFGASIFSVLKGNPTPDLPLVADADDLLAWLPSDCLGRYDRALMQVLHGLLRQPRDERFASAAEVLQALTEIDPSIDVETVDSRLATICQPRFVGRLEELIQLRESAPCSSELAVGAPPPMPFMSINGERGVGKTRLIEKHKTELRISKLRVLSLSSSRGRAEGDDTTLANLESELDSLLGRQKDPESTGTASFPDLADPRRFARYSAIARGAIRLARVESPSVLVVEDIESLDPIAREFLTYLLRRVSAEYQLSGDRLPLQIVMTMTPGCDFDEVLEGLLREAHEDGLLDVIELEAFDLDKSTELLRAMIAPADCSPSVAEVLHAKTHGNPLFLRETLASLQIEADRVLAVEEALALDRVEAAPVATRVRGVIQSRVGLVEDRDLFLLQLVALHPKHVDQPHLARFGGLTAASAKASIDRLSRRGLLSVSRYGALGFVDADTKGVVTEMMSDERQRSLHAQLARALHDETRANAWTAVFHELMSGHITEAVWDRAYSAYSGLVRRNRDGEAKVLMQAIRRSAAKPPRYLVFMATVSAAELACRRGDARGARAELSLTELSDLSASPVTAKLQARSLVMDGEYEQARIVLKKAARQVEGVDVGEAALLCLQRAQTHLRQGDLNETDRVLEEAAAILARAKAVPEIGVDNKLRLEEVESPRLPPPSPYSASQSDFVRLRASLEFRRHNLATALSLALLSLKMEARAGNLNGLGQGRHLVGSIYMQGGVNERAETFFKSAVALQRDIGDLLALADSLNNLGILKRNMGSAQEALDYLRDALRIRQEIGHREGEHQCWANIANIHLRRRELSEAAKSLKICLKLKRKLKGDKNPAIALNSLGAVSQLRHRHAAAIRYYREAAAADRSFGQELRARYWETNAGLTLAAVGLWDEAEETLNRALTAMREHELEEEPAVAMWGLADQWLGRGDVERAEDCLGEALEVFGRVGAESSRLETLVRMMGLHLARGDGDVDRAQSLSRNLAKADKKELTDEVASRLAVLELDLLVALNDSGADEELAEVEAVAKVLREAQKLEMPGVAFSAAAALARYCDWALKPERAFYYASLALECLEKTTAAINEPRMMASFLETPEVRQFRAATRAFISASCPGRDDELRKLPKEVRLCISKLKTGLFDVERTLGTTVSSLRRNEEGVRRILELSQDMTKTMPMDQLLPAILDGAIDFSSAERGFLVLVEDDGDAQVAVARTNRGEPVVDPERQVSRKVIDGVAKTKRPVLLQNAMDEEEYRAQESVLSLELRSIMCVPMLRNQKLLGMIYVDNRSRVGQFRADDLELLGILASQAAIAFENARLVQKLVREEKDRTMGVLAGSVAHDFNNLLAAILGRTQLLLSKLDDDGHRNELETIAQSAREGAIVVRRLQDFTQSSTKRDLEVVDLHAIVDEVMEFTKTRWQSEYIRSGRRVDISNRLGEEVLVRGNRSELREVFTNVLLNAVASLKDSGLIVFDSEVLEDTVRLLVRHDGASITESAGSELFDPLLSRGDSDGSLGMSVAYGILMRHGGKVAIESGADGFTMIVIELPRGIEKRQERPAPALGGSPSVRREGPAPKLLVVDDELGIRSLLEEILKKEGYDVTPAASGPEALEALKAAPFDLVMTDLGMVPMSGWDVAREVKKHRSDLPVILLTGWAEEIGVQNAGLRQVDQVLSKPFEISDLIDAIEKALAAESA
ncbi:MAG: response regulator [Planctomycetota bacterium]